MGIESIGGALAWRPGWTSEAPAHVFLTVMALEAVLKTAQGKISLVVFGLLTRTDRPHASAQTRVAAVLLDCRSGDDYVRKC